MKNPYETKTNITNYYQPELQRAIKNYQNMTTNNFLDMQGNLNNIFSKAISKKKNRGILDISSPGNKDILTDSDSDYSPNKKIKKDNNKYKNNAKNNSPKKGCAQLIIEKVVNQGPNPNEYFYFDAKQRRYNKINYVKLDNNNNYIRNTLKSDDSRAFSQKNINNNNISPDYGKNSNILRDNQYQNKNQYQERDPNLRVYYDSKSKGNQNNFSNNESSGNDNCVYIYKN